DPMGSLPNLPWVPTQQERLNDLLDGPEALGTINDISVSAPLRSSREVALKFALKSFCLNLWLILWIVSHFSV
ncbi:MAG TPA: hypothetical protein VK845_16250, partial [Gemmatimonadales bacterium]|nr:hypothetical protein [Gemmatimonadales bacterium]